MDNNTVSEVAYKNGFTAGQKSGYDKGFEDGQRSIISAMESMVVQRAKEKSHQKVMGGDKNNDV